MVDVLPEILAAGVALVVVLSEWIHLRRIHAIRYLAFGPDARARAWSKLAPVLRVAGAAAVAWGLASLLWVVEEKVHNTDAIDDGEIKHLVLIVDVSPSMTLVDAGPDGDRQRRQRASDIVESIFNRIPMRQFRLTLIAVYTDAKPLLEDSQDHEVVRHVLETMPMWHAFKSGSTRLMTGIELAAKMARPWNPGSAHLVLLTDGDTVPSSGMPRMPPSVASFVVVGVGDPNSGKFIDGHLSRQDVSTLRQVANRLGGVYHNGNQKHLPSQIVDSLVETDGDDQQSAWTRREWALAAILVGSAVLALLPLLLHYLGTGYAGGTPIVAMKDDTDRQSAAAAMAR